jgi:hypothetical protein
MPKYVLWLLVAAVAVIVLGPGTTDAARRTVLFEQAVNAGCG